MVEISEKIICGGNSHFFREVGAPINKAISLIAKEYPVSEDADLDLKSRPQAHLTELVGIIGIMSFVGSWLATKALDEVYSYKISPVIKNILRKHIKEDSTKKYALTISCLNREKNINLIVACVGSTISEIEAAEKGLGKVFNLLQVSSIEAEEGEVLLAVLEGNNLNLEIKRYPDYATSLDALRSMYPAKIPSYLNEKR